ncbi:MAG: BTAD domain-containing putative transcriptional regulator, partial [Bacteroidia bacterium]
MRLELSRHARFIVATGEPVALAPRDAALLAWLAIEGPTARGRLAGLLWPDSDLEASRNSLRQRLFKLRKQTGIELVSGSTTLALSRGVVHDLEESDQVLGDAADEIGGEFGSWLGQQRQRRLDRVRQSLAEFADMAERARDWPDALTHAGELLALEPLSEDVHRRLIRLHYLAGDRAAALLAFDRCERVLKDEVGATPSAETLALLQTVERSALAAAPSPQRVPAAVMRPPRVVGRDAEVAAAHAAWAAGQVVALVGEAGMGKSRLLEHLLPSPGSAAAGTAVSVSARPGDAGVPLATVARLLRAVAERSPQTLEASTRRELARVLPEWA